MSLVEMIDGLINDIGIKSEATIKGRLTKLRQKIEEQDARLKDLKAKIVKLEAQVKKKKLAPNQRVLNEEQVRILKLISKHEALTVRQISYELCIWYTAAEHHKNVLRRFGMIEFAGKYVDEIGDTGEALFKLTEKGMGYVVEHGLE
jgi:uncharacterized protein (DUF342 family)